MKKLIASVSIALLLSGCSTIDTVKKYWPRNHDPVMFGHLVSLSVVIDHIDCEKPDWSTAMARSEELAKYTRLRKDPQADNLDGLFKHVTKMSKGGSKVFCEIGKKTSQQRIDAAVSAWGGR